MEDNIQESSVFDMKSLPTTVTPQGYFSSNKTKGQDYNYLSARDDIDAINRELVQLHEHLLKMRVRAHMLEVDLATQFNPDTVLDIRQVETKCQECTRGVQGFSAQIDQPNSQETDGNNGSMTLDEELTSKQENETV